MKKFTKAILPIFVPATISTGIIFILRYLMIPAQTFQSGMFWLFILASLLVTTACFTAYQILLDAKASNAIAEIVTIGLTIITVIFAIAALIATIMSGKNLITKEKYKATKQQVIESDAKSIAETNKVQLAVNDSETAMAASMGLEKNIKHAEECYDIGEFSCLLYNGKYYWVAPVNYRNFNSYRKAKILGIPGYVLVNAENSSAEYVESSNEFLYSPSAFGRCDLNRHLRKQFPKEIFDKTYFELDETGTPYWVTPVYDSTIGVWGGKIQKAVILTNAVNGAAEKYTAETLPEWVDHRFTLNSIQNDDDDSKEKTESESNSNSNVDQMTATIEEIHVAELNGNTVFYFEFSKEERLYRSSLSINEKQITLQKGDLVSFEYYEDKDEDLCIITKIFT